MRVSAAAAMIRRPVAVDPVNDTRSIRGSVHSTSPMAFCCDVITLSTPAGMSVCSATRRPSTVADHGVAGAALSTTVQPAASAGPTLARLIWWGKFHGVIAATTPIGSRRIVRCDFMPNGAASPMSVSHA